MTCDNCGNDYEYGTGTSNNGWDFCSSSCESEKRNELEKDRD